MATNPAAAITDVTIDADGGYFKTGFPAACSATNNSRGAVFVKVGTVDRSTGAGTPAKSYGYVRFRTRVD